MWQRHNIPVSAIPCLQYRRALDAEAKQASESRESSASAHGDYTLFLLSFMRHWQDHLYYASSTFLLQFGILNC